MTVLGGERPAANGTRPGLYKGRPLARRPHAQTSPPPRPPHPCNHERPLAFQPEDRARRRDVQIGVARPGPGTGPSPDAAAASARAAACARVATTGGSTPCPERGEAAASTASTCPCHQSRVDRRGPRVLPLAEREPAGAVAPQQSPRGGPEHRWEIRRRRALLPMHLRRDPAFAIESTN
jgi:hypothetical protein